MERKDIIVYIKKPSPWGDGFALNPKSMNKNV